jgi:hypothetical protein
VLALGVDLAGRNARRIPPRKRTRLCEFAGCPKVKLALDARPRASMVCTLQFSARAISRRSRAALRDHLQQLKLAVEAEQWIAIAH